MNAKSLIEFENVSFTYEEETEKTAYALKDINLTVNSGEFIVILGHNGSGKSTLAKLSNSIYVPSEGKVFVRGMDTSIQENEFPIRKKVGVVFQNPDNQIVASIIEEDVAFGPENLGVAPAEIRKRVDEALKAVGMYDYRFHETHRISGGQKQRVAIAGIIAMQPECIVLDEPTAMLDPQGRREVMETIRRLNKERGMTVVFITHFMEEAVLADRVIIIDNGTIAADGKPADIFNNRTLLEKCGLGIPEIADIAYKMRQKGLKLPDQILTQEDLVKAFEELIRS